MRLIDRIDEWMNGAPMFGVLLIINLCLFSHLGLCSLSRASAGEPGLNGVMIFDNGLEPVVRDNHRDTGLGDTTSWTPMSILEIYQGRTDTLMKCIDEQGRLYAYTDAPNGDLFIIPVIKGYPIALDELEADCVLLTQEEISQGGQ